MDSGVTAGAFALGGVALGAVLKWWGDAIARHHATAGSRDEAFAAVSDACTRLHVEASIMRGLGTNRNKFRQAVYGVLESEARHPFRPSDSGLTIARQILASGTVYGLRHLMPVQVGDAIRRNLMPVLSEVMVLVIRLSMMGDPWLAGAADRLGKAAGALIEHIDERDRVWAGREAELQAAIGELRRARDAASARWWRRRKLRRGVKAGESAATAT